MAFDIWFIFIAGSLFSVLGVLLWVFLRRPFLASVAMSPELALAALAHRLRLEGYQVAEEPRKLQVRVDDWALMAVHARGDDTTRFRYAVDATPRGWAAVLILAMIVALFVGGIAGLVAVLLSLFNTIPTAAPATPEEALAIITPFIIALLVVVGIAALSYPLLAHAVSTKTGQILLWVGYAAAVGVLAVTYFTLIALFEATIAGTVDPFGFATGFITIILLFVVSYVLYAVGYYLAYSRVKRGEIPA